MDIFNNNNKNKIYMYMPILIEIIIKRHFKTLNFLVDEYFICIIICVLYIKEHRYILWYLIVYFLIPNRQLYAVIDIVELHFRYKREY